MSIEEAKERAMESLIAIFDEGSYTHYAGDEGEYHSEEGDYPCPGFVMNRLIDALSFKQYLIDLWFDEVSFSLTELHYSWGTEHGRVNAHILKPTPITEEGHLNLTDKQLKNLGKL